MTSTDPEDASLVTVFFWAFNEATDGPTPASRFVGLASGLCGFEDVARSGCQRFRRHANGPTQSLERYE